MNQPRDYGQDDLFRSSLEQIINLRHPLVRLATEINWDFLAKRFSSVCRVGPEQPPLPTRLVAGLLIRPRHPRRQGLSDRFKVWIRGQIRRVTKAIRREMRRRAAVEPVIGHLKDDHRMRRNYLKGRDGDRIDVVLAAAGFNFSLLLRWFAELLRVLLLILCRHLAPPHLA